MHRSLNRFPVSLALPVVLAVLVYSGTFSVPFHFDDRQSIVDNHLLTDLGNFLDPGKAGPQVRNTRSVGLLSLALNYAVGGLDPGGYHIVNLGIHVVNSLLVYLLVSLIFRTPSLCPDRGKPPKPAREIALVASLFFASHPVQTQAVTYIVQRYASLATLFYLLSAAMFVRSRRSDGSGVKVFPYVTALLAAVLAMKTKEIAFTLPLALLLCEILFFQGRSARRLLPLLPFFLTMLIIPLGMLGMDKPAGDLLSDVGDVTRLQSDIPRSEYLATQTRVLVTYLRLLLFPVNQNLDYDYPLSHSFGDPGVALSTAVLVSLLLLAFFLLRASRSREQRFRIISFGIFWFFLTLSVESSIIPIRDVIFEHRLYLPSTGVFIAASTALSMLSDRISAQKTWGRPAVRTVVACLVIGFAAAAYARNGDWQDRTSLWLDVTKKSPGKARPYNNLGEALMERQDMEGAIRVLEYAVWLDPSDARPHNNLGIAYYLTGNKPLSFSHLEISLQLKPDFSEAHGNLGFHAVAEGMLDRGIYHLEQSVRLNPYNPKTHLNLAIAYRKKGLMDLANEHFGEARRLKPELFRVERSAQ